MQRSALACTAGSLGCRQQTPNKIGEPMDGEINPSREDYITARKGFRTKLTRVGPSPEPSEMPPPLGVPGALPFTYPSGGLQLLAWVNPEVKTAGPRRPAVMFLHGGFAFSPSHWEYARPFLRAGFHVLIPGLRGENGQSGAYSLLYDEVDDCLACAEHLSRAPSVDPAKIFLCGHGTGGTLALLSSLASDQFRACAAFSPWPSIRTYLQGREQDAPFDPRAEGELRMRSPLYYAQHFRCPVRSFFGLGEGAEGEANLATAKEMGRHARGSTKDVGELTVSGDSLSAIAPSTAATIGFFRDLAGIRA